MRGDQYRAPDGRVMFVSSGISGGRTWGTYWRKPTGSLKRYRGIKCVSTCQAAQEVLDAYAKMKNWELV